MTKKASGEAAILEEFKIKRTNVVLYREDYDMETGKYTMEEVESFFDIKGYSLNGPYLVVQEKDDTQHVYQTESLAKIKITSA
jgi:hypothetical protein